MTFEPIIILALYAVCCAISAFRLALQRVR